MSLRKTFLTAGVIWAPPLAFAAAAATLAIIYWVGRFTPGLAGLGLIVVVLAALAAFAGSIIAANAYARRLARKSPGARVGQFGALLIFVGVLANVAIAVGMVGLTVPHDEEMQFDFVVQELARESAGE